MLLYGRKDFRAWQRVELFKGENRSGTVLASAALGAQLVAHFAAGDEDALRILDLALGHQRQEARLRECVNRRARVRMAKHALRRKHNQRLAPPPPRLAPQHATILDRA